MLDAVIIGGGPGGYVCAIRSAQLGLTVALVEKGDVGGTCLNRGCIPTKAMTHTVDVLMHMRAGAELGLEVSGIRVDFAKVMERKDKITARLRAGVGFLLKKRKIQVVAGTARVKSPEVVTVTDASGNISELETRNVVIATGSEPIAPKVFGYDGVNVITSEEVLSLKSIPKSLLIIGAGVIGCEFAGVFQAFGSDVTLVDIMPNILPMIDSDLANTVKAAFTKRGIKIHTGVRIVDVKVGADGVRVKAEAGEEFSCEKAILSMGRRPLGKGLGLEEAGVELGSHGEVKVDDKMRTNVPGIWAIGDVTNVAPLAHVASFQGLTCAANMAGHDKAMHYNAVPNCIFTTPEVATVGITETRATELGIKYKVGKFPYLASGKALAMGEPEGFVKLIADPDGRIIGGHIVGARASDLIAEITLAVEHGLKVSDIAHTIHAHPTLPETVMEAAEAAMNMAIHI